MSTEAIYAKYWAALMDIDAVMVPADTVIALALRLAVQDAYDAAGAVADDLVAIVAEQATPERSPADQRYAEQLQAQISRLNEWLAENEPGLYISPGDTADAVLAALGNRDERLAEARVNVAIHDCEYVDRQMRMIADWLIANSDGQKTARTPGERILDAIKQRDAEIDGLRQQLAQMDADNANLTQRLSSLAGVQAEAERRRQEIADLREQVIPDYQNSLAALSAEIDRLTRQNVLATDTFNSLTEVHSNGNGPAESAADVPTWWAALDDETNDYRVSLDAGRRTFRQLGKRTRLTLVLAFIRHIGAGAMPTQQKFDAAKPTWMPGGTGLTVTFGCAWSELLTLTPFEVEP